MENSKKTMDKIVALCKNRGFVYPGSEIYGGLANTWDYGPLGVALKNNIKNAWLKKFVQQNKYNVGLDSAILMNPQTWVASGHLGGFSDPLMDCKECKTRHRADNLIEDFDGTNVAGWTNEEMMNYIKEKEIRVLTAASTTLPTFVSSTLCSKHSRALQRTARMKFIFVPKLLRAFS